MHKEKNQKPGRKYHEFPAGTFTIKFGLENTTNYPWTMGLINLIETDDPEQRYVGAIQFDEKVGVVDNTPYPLQVEFEPEPGTINFHVMGATKDFDTGSPIPPEYHFMFYGNCELDGAEVVLSGNGGVPSRFCPDLGGPGADGDNVNWTSKGNTDPHHKRRR
jgi:hypothetical protein